jgi:hypothetical protein
VHGIVRAERAETLALLEAREPELLALFSERGVSADSLRFELGFGGARERSPGALRSAGAPRSSGAPTPASTAPERAAGLTDTDPPRRRDGLVDTYA